MTLNKSISKLNFNCIFLAMSTIAMGFFHEFLSCIASIILCIYLFVFVTQNDGIKFNINFGSISIIIIFTFYGLSTFWAIDSGMAFIGFLKFLPLPLFMLSVIQKGGCFDKIYNILPHSAAFMTAASFLLSFIPKFGRVFTPAGRLTGFFQYANTYALFMLIALIITSMKERLQIIDYIYIPIFILGIILSGSRTVFILTAISVIVILIFAKNKKVRTISSAFLVGITVISALYAAATKNFDSIGRFLTTSLSESTFLGRLLYWYDALPVILRNPFGLGYQGYYYIQPSIQSGLYSVRYIHNDFLQLMLDIGWIPAIIFASAIIRSFFRKGTDVKNRLVLFVISAHCFFDFDLQFVSVFMILILFLDIQNGKEIIIKKSSCLLGAALAGCCSAYMFIPLTASFMENYKLSAALYPWNTDVNIAIISTDDTAEKMDADADKILSQNKYIAIAYSAKAEAAYSQGNFGVMLEYKDNAIENAPFNYDEYIDYIYKLLTGIELYTQAGDQYSADFCRKKLDKVLGKFYSIESKMSYLGKNINDQPTTELPPEILEWIEAIK